MREVWFSLQLELTSLSPLGSPCWWLWKVLVKLEASKNLDGKEVSQMLCFRLGQDMNSLQTSYFTDERKLCSVNMISVYIRVTKCPSSQDVTQQKSLVRVCAGERPAFNKNMIDRKNWCQLKCNLYVRRCFSPLYLYHVELCLAHNRAQQLLKKVKKIPLIRTNTWKF